MVVVPDVHQLVEQGEQFLVVLDFPGDVHLPLCQVLDDVSRVRSAKDWVSRPDDVYPAVESESRTQVPETTCQPQRRRPKDGARNIVGVPQIAGRARGKGEAEGGGRKKETGKAP